MKTRAISAAVTASLLLSLTACGGDDTAKVQNSTETAEMQESLPAGIEKKNYDNAEVNILLPNWGLYPNYFYSEENTGDAIDVALYNREIKVEEYLGIDISHTLADAIGNIPEAIRECTMTGDDLHQIALTHCIYGVASMATEGMLYDLNNIESIDPTAEWWNQSAMENLSMAGHAFYASTDYMIPDPNAVVFNKDFIDKYALDDPYELVRDGKWTFDNMLAMMSEVSQDNGNSMRDIDDTYGLGLPNDWFLTPFIHSSGVLLLDKDDDELFEVSFTTNERTYQMAEKLEALIKGPDTYVYPYVHDFDQANSDPTKSLNITKGRTLFGLVPIHYLHTYRDVDLEFGLLPYPKLDEAQEDYISLDWSGLMCIPASVQKPEIVGEAIELLSYYSSEEVLPAYYDIVLGEKLSRDDDSKEMLDIIFDGIVYDAGVNYFGYTSQSLGKFYAIGNSINAGNWGGLASYVAQYETAAQTEVEKFNMVISELDI